MKLTLVVLGSDDGDVGGDGCNNENVVLMGDDKDEDNGEAEDDATFSSWSSVPLPNHSNH